MLDFFVVRRSSRQYELRLLTALVRVSPSSSSSHLLRYGILRSFSFAQFPPIYFYKFTFYCQYISLILLIFVQGHIIKWLFESR